MAYERIGGTFDRTDYALVTNKKPAPMGVSDEDLYGQIASLATELPSADLLTEFKMAAQSFVDAADAGADIERHVKWFKELLA